MALWTRASRGFFNRLLHHRLVRGVGVLVSGTAAGQAIGVLAAPIITRLYDPSHYGLLAVYASLLGVVGSVSALSYQLPIPMARKDGVAVNVVAVASSAVLCTATLSGMGVLLFARMASGVLETPGLEPLLWLLPLGILGSGAYTVLSHWALRQKAYSQLAKTKLSQSLGGTGTQIGLGLLNADAIGLVLGHIVAQAGGIVSLARNAWVLDRHLLRQVSRKRMRIVARRYRRFPLFHSLSRLLNSAGYFAGPLLVASLFGPQVAGLFALADRIVSTPIRLVATSVGQVYFGEAARMGSEPERLLAMMWKAMRWLAALAVVPFAVFAAAGKPIFVLAFGEPWAEAGVYVQIMAGVFFLRFVTSPVSQNFSILERQDLAVAFNVLRLTLVVAGVVVPWTLGLGARTAIIWYSVAMGATYLLLPAMQIAAVKARGRTLQKTAR